MRRLIWCLLAFILLLQGAAPQTQRMTVFAVASLNDVMKAIDQPWIERGHPSLRLSFAPSSTLARQLDHRASANIFASADEVWMNWAAERNLIDKVPLLVAKALHDVRAESLTADVR